MGLEQILIICRLPDVHVDAVTKHINEANFTFDIWDINNPKTLKFSIPININSSFHYKSVWWRYKGTWLEYQGTLKTQEAFATREWLAGLRGLASLTTDIFWINNPVSTAACNLKIRNLQIAAAQGFKIPQTLITNSPDDFEFFLTQIPSQKAIYKPLTYYYEEDNIAVFTSVVPLDAPTKFKNNIYVTPLLLQEQIEKEFELRITVVGEKAYSVRIDSQSFNSTRIDWRRDQTIENIYSQFVLPEHIESKIISLHKKLGLVYGAYDFIVDKSGEFVFLEVNPSGQWLWLEQATGIEISSAIARLLIDGNIRPTMNET